MCEKRRISFVLILFAIMKSITVYLAWPSPSITLYSIATRNSPHDSETSFYTLFTSTLTPHHTFTRTLTRTQTNHVQSSTNLFPILPSFHDPFVFHSLLSSFSLFPLLPLSSLILSYSCLVLSSTNYFLLRIVISSLSPLSSTRNIPKLPPRNLFPCALTLRSLESRTNGFSRVSTEYVLSESIRKGRSSACYAKSYWTIGYRAIDRWE